MDVSEGALDAAIAALQRRVKERDTEIERLEDQIAGFMLEPGATVKVYVCEEAIKRWRARRASEQKA